MEDDNNNLPSGEELEKLIRKMGGDPSTMEQQGVSPKYEKCNAMYRAVLDKDQLPMFLGIDTDEEMFYIGFGDDEPFILTRTQIQYMLAAMTGLTMKAHEDEFNTTPDEVQEEMIELKERITFGKGLNPGGNKFGKYMVKKKADTQKKLSALKKSIFSTKDPAEQAKLLASLDEIEESLKETLKTIEDAEEHTKDMSLEDKRDYLEKLATEEQDKLGKKAREFERSLMGSVDNEDPETFNLNYFKKVYDTQGQAGLKEELAKIPKEERQEIIQAIMSEYKLKQQKDNEKDS